MTNSDKSRAGDERMPKPEIRSSNEKRPLDCLLLSRFGFRISFGFRHSSFVISPSSPPSPCFEEMLQGLRERLVRAEAQCVHAGALESAIQLLQTFGVGLRELFAHQRAVRIQLEQFARFRIFDGEQARSG